MTHVSSSTTQRTEHERSMVLYSHSIVALHSCSRRTSCGVVVLLMPQHWCLLHVMTMLSSGMRLPLAHIAFLDQWRRESAGRGEVPLNIVGLTWRV